MVGGGFDRPAYCVMVVGQDWGDQRAFEKQGGRDSPRSWTNERLRELLAQAGFAVPAVGPNESSGVFLTNAALCLRKEPGCQGSGNPKWFKNCGPQFLKPQIELIWPKVVVCLGRRAYAAVLAAYDLPPFRDWRAAVDGPGIKLAGGPLAFAVYHCSQVIWNTHRKEPEQLQDWKRIGIAIARMSNGVIWTLKS